MKKRLTALLLCFLMICTSFVACDNKEEAKTGILGESDLTNVKIGVIDCSKSEAFVQKYKENGCEIIELESRVEILKAFANGEIDCAIMDENHAKQLISETPELELRGEALGEDTLTFSVLKSNKVYKIMLDKALAALKADGTVDAIVNGYLNDPDYEYEFADKLDASNGSFMISIDSSMYPYVFPAEDEYDRPDGIALALIDAMCEYLGCDYSLATITTSSLSSSLRMGFSDFAIGSYALENMAGYEDDIVETEPILTYNHVIVVKK